jgi:GH15 family glucan-1,4-alpha-glucosidase
MTVPLEDYATIGDRRTAALVSRFGSIDWLCWPRFDSDACFASLIGGPENGRWSITPSQGFSATRRYQTDTMVLETDFETESGSVRLIDFMVPQEAASTLVRTLVGVKGTVSLRLQLDLRYDYGKVPPWTEPCEQDSSRGLARI